MISQTASFLVYDLLRLIHKFIFVFLELLVGYTPAIKQMLQLIINFFFYIMKIVEALALHFEMLDLCQEGRFIHQFLLLLVADVLGFAVLEVNLSIILLWVIVYLSRSQLPLFLILIHLFYLVWILINFLHEPVVDF